MRIKERTSIALMILLISGLISCTKSKNCFTSSGELTRDTLTVSSFDSIYLNDNVTLILTQETGNRVVVEAGKNLISGITAEVSGASLVIHNNNSCNWLREYSNPVVYVSFSYYKHILFIAYKSSGDVRSTNLLYNDTIEIHTWGGSGIISLYVNCRKVTFVQHMGTVNFLIQGICDESNIFAGDYGLFDCRDLRTGYTYIKNYGTNDCYVQAKHQLIATVGSIGNIYYKSNPPPEVIIKNPQNSDQILPIPAE